MLLDTAYMRIAVFDIAGLAISLPSKINLIVLECGSNCLAWLGASTVAILEFGKVDRDPAASILS